VTVANHGEVAPRPGPARISGPDADAFRIVDDGCAGGPLAPNRLCELSVRFAPVTTGDAHARLTIEAVAGSPQIVALSGTGDPAPAAPAGPQGEASVIICKDVLLIIKCGAVDPHAYSSAVSATLSRTAHVYARTKTRMRKHQLDVKLRRGVYVVRIAVAGQRAIKVQVAVR
jgi:hypothetical protein